MQNRNSENLKVVLVTVSNNLFSHKVFFYIEVLQFSLYEGRKVN